MTSLVWRKKHTSEAIANVGMEGGFYTMLGQVTISGIAGWGMTNLDKKPFGRLCTVCQNPPQRNDLEENLQWTKDKEKKPVARL
jgi:hypothetical protein